MTAAGFTAADPVLFDLDGTITASGPGILNSVRHALATLGHPEPDEAALGRFIGPPLLDSFRVECAMDEEQAWQAVLAYRTYYEQHGQFQNSVYEGIPAVLAALRAAGRRLVVATSKAEPYARSILAHFGLLDMFDAVVGSELDGRRTAKAEVIAAALARVGAAGGGATGGGTTGPGLGDRSAGAVMIGDRSHDVVGAAALGVPTIGALWGYGTADELRGAGAALVLAEPLDLLGVLLPVA